MKKDREIYSRRNFLRMATALSGAIIVETPFLSCDRETKKASTIWRLNPAFRIQEIIPDALEIYTFNGEGKRIQYRLEGLEADFLRALEHEETYKDIVEQISHKHSLDYAICSKILDKSIDEFSKAGIVYSGEKMFTIIKEIKYVKKI